MKKKLFIFFILIVVVVIIGGGYLYFSGQLSYMTEPKLENIEFKDNEYINTDEIENNEIETKIFNLLNQIEKAEIPTIIIAGNECNLDEVDFNNVNSLDSIKSIINNVDFKNIEAIGSFPEFGAFSINNISNGYYNMYEFEIYNNKSYYGLSKFNTDDCLMEFEEDITALKSKGDDLKSTDLTDNYEYYIRDFKEVEFTSYKFENELILYSDSIDNNNEYKPCMIITDGKSYISLAKFKKNVEGKNKYTIDTFYLNDNSLLNEIKNLHSSVNYENRTYAPTNIYPGNTTMNEFYDIAKKKRESYATLMKQYIEDQRPKDETYDVETVDGLDLSNSLRYSNETLVNAFGFLGTLVGGQNFEIVANVTLNLTESVIQKTTTDGQTTYTVKATKTDIVKTSVGTVDNYSLDVTIVITSDGSCQVDYKSVVVYKSDDVKFKIETTTVETFNIVGNRVDKSTLSSKSSAKISDFEAVDSYNNKYVIDTMDYTEDNTSSVITMFVGNYIAKQ